MKNPTNSQSPEATGVPPPAPGSAVWCPKCVGDGWLTGEWDTCPACYGTGRNTTDEERRIYRVRRAERESKLSAKRLDAAEREHAAAMAELAAAQEALFEAARQPNAERSRAERVG